tara:strand:+ start:13335 stop:13547 length:213 start_codon:yes stop_codon:yes gene_type:complete
MFKRFTEHPKNNNMTYFQHFCFSCNLGFQFSIASIYAYIHAAFPFLYETSSQDYAATILNAIDEKKIHKV